MTGKRGSDIKARLGPIHQEKKARRASTGNELIHRGISSRIANPRPAAIVRTVEDGSEREFFAQVNIIICDKFIKAQIDSGIQTTLIGTAVAELVTQSTGQRSLCRIIGRGENRRSENVLNVRLGTRLSRMRDIECIINTNIGPKSAVLGMKALKSLGYQMVVGGRHSYQTTATKRTTSNSKQQTEEEEREAEKGIPFFDSEDEQMIFEIDPEEAREIETN